MKDKIKNTLYAIGLEIIFIPMIWAVSYFLINHNLLTTDMVAIILISIGIILLNVAFIYLVSFLVNRFIHMPLIYYLVVGAISTFILLWVRVFYKSTETLVCANLSATGCLDAIKNSKFISMALIMALAYYFIYVLMHKMTQTKVDKKRKKKKRNNKKTKK